MNRKTFIQQLEYLLSDWPNPQEREEEILQYEEMLVDLTDEEASQKIEQMGGPQGVAQELRQKKGLPPAADIWQPAEAPAETRKEDWGWSGESRAQSGGTGRSPAGKRIAQPKENNRRFLIGVIAAVVVVLAVIAGVLIWTFSRQAQSDTENGEDSSSEAHSGGQTPDVDSQPGTAASEKVPLPEGTETAVRLSAEISGGDLTVKSGDSWDAVANGNAVECSVTEGCLELRITSGACVPTVPDGLEEIRLTGSRGTVELQQLQADVLEIDAFNINVAMQEVTASSLSVRLQMGSLEADGLALAEKLTLDLQSGNARLTMEQPESYGYTVGVQQGSFALGQDSWSSEDQLQQAQQTAEGFQFEVNVKQGSGSISFSQPEQLWDDERQEKLWDMDDGNDGKDVKITAA